MKMIPYAEKARRHLAAADPSMAALVGRVGACRLETHECAPYESLVRAIVYQQLSGKAAATIFGRLRAACRDDVAPKRLAALSDAALRAAGISPQKLGYLRNLTEHSAAGRLDFRNIHNNSDEEIIDSLVQVKGIGIWSAQMFLMFALGRPDVLPVGDLGIQKAAMKVYKLRKMPSEDKLIKLSAPWRPYRTVGCWYLWRSLDAEGKIGE